MVEPMQLTVLPDGKIIYIERRGKMKMYFPEEQRTRVIHEFDVCTSGNYEDGLHGITIDPDFTENHYLYLYYSICLLNHLLLCFLFGFLFSNLLLLHHLYCYNLYLCCL